jgi:hypothetical protein
MLCHSPRWIPPSQRWRDWAAKFGYALTNKRKRLNTPGFEKYSENWLLLVDFLGFLDVSDREPAMSSLNELFSTPCSNDYDVIFVHSEQFLFRYESGMLHCEYAQRLIRPSPQLV